MGAIAKAALVTTKDTAIIMAIIIEVMAVITGAVNIIGTIGGIATTTGTAIIIATSSVIITMDPGTTIHTGPMRHTITITEWPFPSLIPPSVSDSAPATNPIGQAMPARWPPMR
jgi:hypothetical protein